MDTSKNVHEVLAEELRAHRDDNVLNMLSTITQLKQAITEEERKVVFSALKNHTWREVGEALGVSKQAVFQRFGRDWIQYTKAKNTELAMQKIIKEKRESRR